MSDEKGSFNKWQSEQAYLEEQKKLHPELFVRKEGIGLDAQLSRIGIVLPHQPVGRGFIKYFPFDFIVEEIEKDDQIVSVDYEPATSPHNSGPFLTADLVKIGISTVDVLKELAAKLKIKETQIGYGGIKDAIALTSQRLSFSGIKPEDLLALPNTNHFLKNLEFSDQAVSMNIILGNRFTILIRTKDPIDEKALADRVKMLSKEGFWNFYWLQRFGNRLLSHWWGLLLLQGREERVVRSYLCEAGPNESAFFANLRKQANTKFGNWEEMIELYRPFEFTLRNELIMLGYLREFRHDYTGALRAISEQVKLWLYAYASFLFNKTLSIYANGESSVPKQLPLLLSNNAKDFEIYKQFLEADKVSLDFGQKIRRFDFIRLIPRKVETKFLAKIHKYEVVPEGVVISFDIPKGAYATTFLSQIFTLDPGLADEVSTEQIDPKNVLQTGSIQKTKEVFKDHTVFRQKEED